MREKILQTEIREDLSFYLEIDEFIVILVVCIPEIHKHLSFKVCQGFCLIYPDNINNTNK